MDGVEVFGDLFCGLGIYFGTLEDGGISMEWVVFEEWAQL